MMIKGYKFKKGAIDKRLEALGMTKRGVSYAITGGMYGNWLQSRTSPSRGEMLVSLEDAERVAAMLKVELTEIATYKELKEKPKKERENSLKRIEQKIDLLLDELGINQKSEATQEQRAESEE